MHLDAISRPTKHTRPAVTFKGESPDASPFLVVRGHLAATPERAPLTTKPYRFVRALTGQLATSDPIVASIRREVSTANLALASFAVGFQPPARYVAGHRTSALMALASWHVERCAAHLANLGGAITRTIRGDALLALVPGDDRGLGSARIGAIAPLPEVLATADWTGLVNTFHVSIMPKMCREPEHLEIAPRRIDYWRRLGRQLELEVPA